MDELFITGAQFREMVMGGAALLEKKRQEVDALNVFPVPDGDTGTNMCMTMQSAARELSKLKENPTVSEVADAMSMGALRGARGNSGVILSQLFRGFSKALKGKQNMDADLVAEALARGAEAGYKAVMHPKEGTILTVSRAMAKGAVKAQEKGANVYKLMDVIIETGERALMKTPEMLPVLKEAGVVDSGGMGLLIIYKGFKMALDGEDISDYQEEIKLEKTEAPAEKREANITFGYCTEFFIIHLESAFSEADLDDFRKQLNRIGDSVVAVHDNGMVKVHVHTDSPGKVLQMALRFGELDKLKIENMREQNRELTNKRKQEEKEAAVISVSSGKGLTEVFKELGANYIIEGGQTMNPSIDSISNAIYEVNARNVYILPNNSNIILAAQQAEKLAECNVVVIPSKSIPQGLSAMLAMDPGASVDENTKAMQNAIRNVVSGAVTYAVRKTRFNGKEISEGDILGLLNNDLTFVGKDVSDTTVELFDEMAKTKEGSAQNAMLFFGEDVKEEDAEQLLGKLEEKYPDIEFVLQSGGQSLYYYYISLE